MDDEREQAIRESVTREEGDGPIRVLHVEDDPADGRLLELHLPDMAVTRVARLSEMKEKLRGDAGFDVVLLDLALPDSRGMATLEEALRVSGTRPVVVLTGAADEEVGVRAVRRGAHDYVVKTAESYSMVRRVLRYAVERSALQSRFAHLDRLAMVGAITAGVAHELANPAGFVDMNTRVLAERLEQLERQLPNEPVVAECLEIVHDNLLGLDQVRALLHDMARFTRPDQVGEAELVSIPQVIEGTARLMRSPISDRATLVVEVDDVPPIRGDARRLQQVLVNLLANAREAIPEGARGHRVEVACRLAEDALVVEVTDDGVGMDEATLRRVFDPLYTTKGARGTGLGLSLSAEIARQHGGALSARSRVGEGTTFTLRLPLQNTIPPPATASRGRILIVDDDTALLLAYGRRLGDTHHVVRAASVEAARSAVRQDPAFDLVLSDIGMPDGGGPAVYEAVVRDAPELLPRLVFWTGGQTSPEEREFCRDVPNRVLHKPVDPALIRHLAAEAVTYPGPGR